MEALWKQVQRARRRLFFQEYVRTLPWWLTGTLLLSAVLVAVGKFYPMGVVDWHWVAGGAALGLILALAWTFYRRQTALDAAIELDKRFGLKERVSSTLALRPEEQDSEAGQALLTDTLTRVQKLHVPEHFAVSPSWWSLMPLAPAAIALGLAFFLTIEPAESEAASKQVADAKKVVKNKLAEERKKRDEALRKEAAEKGLKDAEAIYNELIKSTKEQVKNGELDKKEGHIKLNDLAKELEKRREKLGDAEELKKQLNNQFKNLTKGPADEMAEAMKEGDFKQAMKELAEIKEQVAKGEMNEQDRQKLAEQLKQMEKKINELADAQKQAQEDLKKQIKEKQQAGDNQAAQELEQQLAKLEQQDEQMQKMQQLAQKLGECAKCMQEGDSEKALENLEAMQGELQAMQDQMEELAELEGQLDEIADAKNQLNGEGDGDMGDMGGMGQGNNQNGNPGRGLGEGRGRGARPEEADDVGFYDTRARQKVGRGSLEVTGLADGESNVVGELSQEELKAQYEAARSDDSDPLTGQQLPRNYRDHVKGYFDAMRDGK